jgi:gliding motility-associated-like protein
MSVQSDFRMKKLLLLIVIGFYAIGVLAQSKTIKAEYNVQATGRIYISTGEATAFYESCAGNDGYISLDISGNGPFTIEWKDNSGTVVSTEAELSGVTAGDYTVTITDSKGCILTETFTVEYYCPYACLGYAEFSGSTPTTCNQSNGSLSFQITPSTNSTSFNYELSRLDIYLETITIEATGSGSGNTALTIPNLMYGSYTLKVTENGTCSYSTTGTVNNSNFNIVNYSSSGLNPTPNGNCASPSGKFNFDVSGSAPNYIVRWKIKGESTENSFESNSASIEIPNLKAARYLVRIEHKDTPGCYINAEGVIDNNGIFLFTSNELLTAQTHCSPANGAISITVGGGSGNYFYDWDGPGGRRLTKDITGLTAGTYRLKVTDLVSGCTLPFNGNTFVVGNSTTIPTATHTIVNNTNCSSPFNGSITVNASGTPGPYSYNWYYIGQPSVEGTETISNLPAGNYGYYVEDMTTGCKMFMFPSNSTAPKVQDLSAPTVSITSSTITPDSNCPETTGNGAINITIDSTVPYTTSWTGPNSYTANNTNSITNLDAGFYYVSITVNCNAVIPNEPPIIANVVSPLVYSGGELNIVETITVSDTDNPNLVGATISFSTGYDAGKDELLFTNQNGIAGTFNAINGTLSLTGNISIAHYETALRSIRFKNSNINRSMTERVLILSVHDGTDESNHEFVTIQMADIESQIVVYSGVSPNGDAANQFFKITSLPPGSKVSIYNRWGDVVYTMKDYDITNVAKRFEGRNNHGNELSSGTYFYKIHIPDGRELTGYLVLKR